MKTAAMILGILGGLAALSLGAYGFALGGLISFASPGSTYGTLMQFLSVAIPVVGLIGGGMVKAKPGIGSVLLFGSSAALVAIIGFNFLTFVAVTLMVLAGILGLAGASGDAATPAMTDQQQ